MGSPLLFGGYEQKRHQCVGCQREAKCRCNYCQFCPDCCTCQGRSDGEVKLETWLDGIEQDYDPHKKRGRRGKKPVQT